MSFRRRFFADRRGSISVAVALSIAVFMTGIGVALDYARISSSQTSLQSALDSAILSAGKGVLATGEAVDKTRMIAEIKANLPEHLQKMADNVEITQTAGSLSARLSGTLDNRFGFLLGAERSTVAVAASVPLGAIGGGRIELALVLDTTGSMLGAKMEEMKKAAKNLIDVLEVSKKNGADIAVGVVPFTSEVRVETSNISQPWLKLLPLVNRIDGKNGGAEQSEGPWNGCILDRSIPLNRQRAVPTPGVQRETYPGQMCMSGVRTILPLTSDLGQVRAKVDSLAAHGSTNTTIGLAWGLNILNPAAPLGNGAAPAGLTPVRYLVFLTDGRNSLDRFEQTTLQMDDDMRALCRDAKTSDVRIFTVRVIEGNDILLRDCATDPADFYAINRASDLQIVFRSIVRKMIKLRLSS